jgi:hypothetical protein
MKNRKPRSQGVASSPIKDGRSRRRARPVPGWIVKQKDLDEIARRRCLLILSVLSGEKAVSEAIEEVKISRPLYYDLETRALRAMLTALTPHPSASTVSGAVTPSQRIAELEAKVARLEREKRRAERLLLLTRHVVKPGPLKTSAGRPAKRARPSSSRAGCKPSGSSTTQSGQPSHRPVPTPGGEAGP